VIRQAISCDICATEKKQTNHWFVACIQGDELRISGWNSRNRLRPGSKHLCGQTCLHKLVDDFMARILAVRANQAVGEKVAVEVQKPATDTSLTSNEAYEEFESSARLITTPVPISPNRPVLIPTAEIAALPQRLPTEEPESLALEEPPAIATRNWRAEAWKRERERELRASGRRPAITARRRSS